MSTFLNGLGIFGLTIACNFTGDLFNCGIKKELTNNPLAKHTVGFMLLLFFVVLTSKDDYLEGLKPDDWIYTKLLKNTAMLYVLFILFTKTTFMISIILILIVVFVMFMNLEKPNKSKKTKDQIEQWQKLAGYLGLILLLYGVFENYQKQRKDHYDEFSLYKFFIGTTKCAWEK